jgi:hypothetical protein
MAIKAMLLTVGCVAGLAAAACSAPASAPQQQAPAATATAPATPITATPAADPSLGTPVYPTTDAGLLPAIDGAVPGQCVVNTGRPNCDTCVKTTCCTQVNACDSDPDCVAADDCTSLCVQQYGANQAASQQCQSQCMAQHPLGGQKLSTVYQCVQATCLAQCQ